jgi:hypothetical protein
MRPSSKWRRMSLRCLRRVADVALLEADTTRLIGFTA